MFLRNTISKWTLICALVILCDAKDNVGDDACDEADANGDEACIKCTLGKMSDDDLMLSDAAKDFFGKEENRKHEKHKINNLQVFHCQCVKTSKGEFVKGTFDIDKYDDFDEFVDEDDEEWGDWKKSEVLKISDCGELDLVLDGSDSNGIQSLLSNDDEKQTILIVENIEKLYVGEKLQLAKPDEGRFISVTFRNVTFNDKEDEDDNSLDFSKNTEDMIELIFENINITKGTFKIEQINTNIDDDSREYAVGPTIMITNSTIGAPIELIDLIEGVDNNGYAKPDLDFKILIGNAQRDKICVAKQDDDDDDGDIEDCGDDCYFDYKGNVKISMNRFTFLNKEAISILNGEKFEFFGNNAGFVLNNALHITNMKNLNISENRFEFIGKTPALKIVYEYSAYKLEDKNDFFPEDFSNSDKSTFNEDCGHEDDESFASMSKSDIDVVDISKNFFGKFKKETIEFVISDDKKMYPREFIVDKFAPKEVSSRELCKCPIPKPIEDDDNAYDESISNNLTMIGLMKADCLSPQHHMPVMGKREDICMGKYPKPVKERLEEAKKGIKPWHLILAILLSIMITAIVVFVIVRFCCTPEESKSRTVSPNLA